MCKQTPIRCWSFDAVSTRLSAIPETRIPTDFGYITAIDVLMNFFLSVPLKTIKTSSLHTQSKVKCSHPHKALTGNIHLINYCDPWELIGYLEEL